jgi:hypothetical protein
MIFILLLFLHVFYIAQKLYVAILYLHKNYMLRNEFHSHGVKKNERSIEIGLKKLYLL